MTDRPILFSVPMVRALLAGTKTQTRRVLKPQPGPGQIAALYPTAKIDWQVRGKFGLVISNERLPYAFGDRLYVREAFSYDRLDIDRDMMLPPWYWADGDDPGFGDWTRPKPSIHMPRLYSRITLIVKDVKVERVADISEADACAEGMDAVGIETGLITANSVPIEVQSWTEPFSELWDALNAKRGYPWASNPWIVAISFTVINQNIDKIGA